MRNSPVRTAIPSTNPRLKSNPLSLPPSGKFSSRTVASESVLLGVGELSATSESIIRGSRFLSTGVVNLAGVDIVFIVAEVVGLRILANPIG